MSINFISLAKRLDGMTCKATAYMLCFTTSCTDKGVVSATGDPSLLTKGTSGSMDLLRDPTLTPSGWDLDQGA